MSRLECGHSPSGHGPHTTGYGTDKDGNRHCWDCCADRDRESMRETGRATLYLTDPIGGPTEVTNWPGTLRISCSIPKTGGHNFAGVRYDIWFTFDGCQWHGVQYGGDTQICHCRRLKS